MLSRRKLPNFHLLSTFSHSLRRLSGRSNWNNQSNIPNCNEFEEVSTFGDVNNQLEYRNQAYTAQGSGNVRWRCPRYENPGYGENPERLYEQRGVGDQGDSPDQEYREMWSRSVQCEMMQLGYDRVQGHEQVEGNNAQWSSESRNVHQGMMQPGYKVPGHGQAAGNEAQWSPETLSGKPGYNRVQGLGQVAGKQADLIPKIRNVPQGTRPGYNPVQGHRHVAGNQAHSSPETRSIQQGMIQPGYNQVQGRRHVAGNHAQWSPETRNVQQGMMQPGYNRVQGHGRVPGNQANGSPETRSVQQGVMQPGHNQVQGQGEHVENQLPSSKSSTEDLLALCQQGKIKESIELMDKGEKADAQCFRLLFEVCEKSGKYEDAKKVYEYFLRSTCRSDHQLFNEVLKMYSNCDSLTDARRVLDQMLQRSFSKSKPRPGNRTCSSLKPQPSFVGRTDFLNLLIKSNPI